MSIKVIFFGTPELALPTLQALLNNNYHISLIVTSPDKPAGRGRKLTPPPVKEFALIKKIPVIQPKKLTDNIIEQIKGYQADLGIVVAYGKIIPLQLIQSFPYGIINIHPSLLPRWRGASPIQSALLSGDKITGVSIMLLDEKLDHGPILTQRQTFISDDDYASTLTVKLFNLGAELLINILPLYLEGKITPKPQDERLATFCQKISKDDAEIDWHDSAENIMNKIRAYDIWPVAWTRYSKDSPFYQKNQHDNIIKIYRAEIVNAAPLTPGYFQLNRNNKTLLIGTGTLPLSIKELQLPNKKRMTIVELINGMQNIKQ